ncbi:unnamed protein product [Periconia digitata]|uniref:Uncharacterized protein n=1 Tax=Periconia digitata TaxID=1303443 RepID=A0A9W4U9H9_9PLEO|nr:unnamed protein product [Periconia digitata]
MASRLIESYANAAAGIEPEQAVSSGATGGAQFRNDQHNSSEYGFRANANIDNDGGYPNFYGDPNAGIQDSNWDIRNRDFSIYEDGEGGPFVYNNTAHQPDERVAFDPLDTGVARPEPHTHGGDASFSVNANYSDLENTEDQPAQNLNSDIGNNGANPTSTSPQMFAQAAPPRESFGATATPNSTADSGHHSSTPQLQPQPQPEPEPVWQVTYSREQFIAYLRSGGIDAMLGGRDFTRVTFTFGESDQDAESLPPPYSPRSERYTNNRGRNTSSFNERRGTTHASNPAREPADLDLYHNFAFRDLNNNAFENWNSRFENWHAQQRRPE